MSSSTLLLDSVNFARSTAAITAHATLWAALAFTTLTFIQEPLVQITILSIGTAIVVFSTWQSVRGIRIGEPLREALCWLWD